MLVLTRKQGQSITIGDDVKVKILDIGSNFIKIGIDAPREVPVYREELLNKESDNESRG